uniref:Uncharacterized protein n=1 Tax=Meloidogyne enterolobii TaxID=390850 RepID=A0A6V7TTF4_MELEN|nr:unnamed protein product [Meloidogyne enterolobii]
MAEDEISNIDMELIPNQSDYLIKFQSLQIKLIEEKENSLNLEKKVFYLEKEKEFNEKIKEIENKNIFLENKLKEKKEKIQKIKFDNQQKDEKINLLEEQIKRDHYFCTRVYLWLNFIKINNKWKEIDIDKYSKCCENKCINLDKPIGECIKGNGFINLINEENVKYIKCVEGKGVNKDSLIYTENSFKKPQNSINYSVFYFEIKCMKIEGVKNQQALIGFKRCADNRFIRFGAANASVFIGKDTFKLPIFSWNNNDVFGYGLVYPPENFPYIFFTQNGKQIGKAILLNENNDSYKPYILLNCCSVETNFGNNLEENPFIYDFSKHLIPKFY